MNKNDYLIRLETPADYAEVEYLVRESFWNVYRPGCLEHYPRIKTSGIWKDSSFFLCKELIPGYLDGVTGEYATPKGYFVDENKAEEFDKQFPYKEKLKLPGQLV